MEQKYNQNYCHLFHIFNQRNWVYEITKGSVSAIFVQSKANLSVHALLESLINMKVQFRKMQFLSVSFPSEISQISDAHNSTYRMNFATTIKIKTRAVVSFIAKSPMKEIAILVLMRA